MQKSTNMWFRFYQQWTQNCPVNPDLEKLDEKLLVDVLLKFNENIRR